ncbi:hypothetical protein GCM10007301_29430 [Azorhizobium oxalatiphilum]|uniref:ABC transporter n=1 Tax=Azorhizobium oxalatiphilum TaxID=980631 RepID=A0A917C1K3_9HYPH|nr:DUF808 domain-containing protein [Azorhizobium oxalatiphilum]GGF67836.1 hypothetical protein GCM10007301_29430 [Azorhizobium oxalatiphilum]
MSIGLIGLLDDVAALAKVAAASLDDVAAQAGRAGAKAAGVVIDDAAVTPRYVMGFSPDRELPIVGKIALGSVRNKLVFLLPAALALSTFAPWAITPLLMLGGAYLSYEGVEKIHSALLPEGRHAQETDPAPVDANVLEDQKVASAIKTDLILSGEIMAITLASVPTGSLWAQAFILAVVGVGITGLVYGGVALIVKADDVGLAMAKNALGGISGSLIRRIGRAMVIGMPMLLKILSIVGTAAMIWVGGGIIVHGLETFGLREPAHTIHAISVSAADRLPGIGSAVEWIIGAVGSGLAGLALGAVIMALVGMVVVPTLKILRRQ